MLAKPVVISGKLNVLEGVSGTRVVETVASEVVIIGVVTRVLV